MLVCEHARWLYHVCTVKEQCKSIHEVALLQFKIQMSIQT